MLVGLVIGSTAKGHECSYDYAHMISTLGADSLGRCMQLHSLPWPSHNRASNQWLVLRGWGGGGGTVSSWQLDKTVGAHLKARNTTRRKGSLPERAHISQADGGGHHTWP